jgi:site-specific DNA-methyltransferase (adenine-specific)
MIIHGDALEEMEKMADNSAALILVDPPYFRFKALDWDRQWETKADYLAWIGKLCEQWQRILNPNGSLYCFASPQMAAHVEVTISEWFNVLNSIVWAKPDFSTKAEMTTKESKRAYFASSERIIFAEHHGADNIAKGEAGYVKKCDELRGFVFEPLMAYLDSERVAAGVSFEDVRQMVGCAPGSGLPSHWFTKSQWALPTEENYRKLQAGFNNNGSEHLRREYEHLRREYEHLRREYEDLRRPFFLSADIPYTDVWRFRTVAHYPGKHECEKPQALLRHIIEVSSKPGDLVLDCFAGSGSTGQAAISMRREFVGIEISEHWADYARNNISHVQMTLV